jgi:hypothetical protein
VSWRRTLQAMRASLLAKATASLFLCNRSDAVLSHARGIRRSLFDRHVHAPQFYQAPIMKRRVRPGPKMH